MERKSPSTVDVAYRRLLDRLVAFDFKPEARLNESEIATDLGMSRAPVREALNRLIADGLVRFEPGRGFFCRKLSVREITELYEVRLDLEVSALKRTLAEASDDALTGFIDAQRAAAPGLSGGGGAGGVDGGVDVGGVLALSERVAADEAFHLDLAGLAGNAPRLKYLRNINDHIRFVRRINLDSPDRAPEALGEHECLLDAIATRDATRAIPLLTDHLHRSTDQVRHQVQTALARIYAADVA